MSGEFGGDVSCECMEGVHHQKISARSSGGRLCKSSPKVRDLAGVDDALKGRIVLDLRNLGLVDAISE